MKQWLYGVVLIAAFVLGSWTPGWGQTRDMPLPQDVHSLHEPLAITLGEQPIQAQAFSTTLSRDELRAFYERELPKSGWRITPVPWIADTQQRHRQFQRDAERYAKEVEQDPQLKEQVGSVGEGFARFEAQAQGLLYAVRQQEHLLLNIQPPDEEGTLVFVNRWQTGPLQEGFDTAFGERDTWPNTNPCCNGQAVPDGSTVLPSSIPRYPNARIISAGAPASQEEGQLRTAFSMYLTADSADQVADYFQSHMAYHGWSAEGLSPDVEEVLRQELPDGLGQSFSVKKTLLSFRSAQARCAVMIAQDTSEAAEAAQEGDPEQTLFSVMYVETLPLERSFTDVVPNPVQ